MDKLLDFLILFLAQFAGGPGPIENNLMRFGLPAILWAALWAIAWSRQRRGELAREKWLVWGFGLGMARELFMFSHVSVRILGVAEHEWTYFITEPLEHALTMASVIVVAGAFLRYILQDALLSHRYLRIGLGATALCFLVTSLWWPQHIVAHPEIKFHQTWGAWLFHVTISLLILAAIVLLTRKKGWLRNVVSVALLFFFLGEFLMLFNFATDKAHAQTICPIANSFHIWAIPLLGYVYLREQSIEKKQAEQELDAYRGHLEELVEARTAELQKANKQLQQEIAERLLTEKALAQLSRRNELILNSAGEGIFGVDLEGNHTFVNRAAARMLGYESDELIGEPSHQVWHHSRPDGRPYPEEECPLHAGYKAGKVCRGTDQVFWRKDGTNFPVRYVSTPMRENGQLTGAVVVFQDITERKQAEKEIARRNAELAAQNAIAATISQSLDLDKILSPALDSALEVMGMESGCIFLWDPDHQTLALQLYSSEKSPDAAAAYARQQCLCEDISHQAVREVKPIILHVSEQPAECRSAFVVEDELQILVSTPLISQGRPVGALTLGTRQPSAIQPQELNLLTAIGQQIGMAVENARLYQEKERSVEELALLHEVSLFLNSTLDPVKIYDQITQQAAKLLGCQSSLIFRWDEERQVAFYVSGCGVNEYQRDALKLQLDESPLLPDLLAHRRSIPIKEGQTDPRVPSLWRETLNVEALLCLPVWGTDKPLGFLFIIDTHQPRQWRQEEVTLVESFVNRAAVALENAYLHKQLEWAAALEERQRIAAEMHDGLAQTLSYLGLRVDRAIELLETHQVGEALGEHQQIREAISTASHQVRRSIASLQESPRPRRPLQDCLSDIVDEFQEKQEPRVRLVNRIPAPVYLPPAQTEQVLRVVREALLNADRHAQAQKVTLCLEDRGPEIAITIADDGQGFDPDAQAEEQSDHFGLSIMRVRAARIGGCLKIDTALGQGTQVTLTWPASVGTTNEERVIRPLSNTSAPVSMISQSKESTS